MLMAQAVSFRCLAVRVIAAVGMFIGFSAAGAAAFECEGNISIDVRDDKARIIGDNLANCAHIYAMDGRVFLYPQGGTKIDGVEAVGALPLITSLRSVTIDLKEGNDRADIIDVEGSNLRWVVRGRSGNDFLAFGRVTAGRILLDGGPGDDTLVLSQVTSQRANVVGWTGSADNLILDGEIAAGLAIKSVESHAYPALSCPLAETTPAGPELIGLADLEVIECEVKKDLDGTEGALVGIITATSATTGQEFSYFLQYRTAVGIAAGSAVFNIVEGEVRNGSLGTILASFGPYSETPQYWLRAFNSCYDLFIHGCPDHLNRYSGGVVDVGPGASSDDGGPI